LKIAVFLPFWVEFGNWPRPKLVIWGKICHFENCPFQTSNLKAAGIANFVELACSRRWQLGNWQFGNSTFGVDFPRDIQNPRPLPGPGPAGPEALCDCVRNGTFASGSSNSANLPSFPWKLVFSKWHSRDSGEIEIGSLEP
jgi:hypothetical protein